MNTDYRSTLIRIASYLRHTGRYHQAIDIEKIIERMDFHNTFIDPDPNYDLQNWETMGFLTYLDGLDGEYDFDINIDPFDFDW